MGAVAETSPTSPLDIHVDSKVYGRRVTTDDSVRPRWPLSLLLVAAALLFVVGVVAERHVTDTHPEHQDAAATTHVEGSDETAEAPAKGVESSTGVPSAERVFGINVESNGLAIAAVTASLALALLAWRSRKQTVVLAIAAFAAAFTVLDVTELAHQIRESRTGLAALAAVIAVVHAAVLAIAAGGQRSSSV